MKSIFIKYYSYIFIILVENNAGYLLDFFFNKYYGNIIKNNYYMMKVKRYFETETVGLTLLPSFP